MGTSNNSREQVLQMYFAVMLLGFSLFFYFITPFRLFYYWKIPLLEDNITTLIWIIPILAFFPLYQFLKESIPKNIIKILIILMAILYFLEIFADSYVGIVLIFEGFIISVLFIHTMKILSHFHSESSQNKHYILSLSLGFILAGFGALCLFINALIYQIFFGTLALSGLFLSFLAQFTIEGTPKETPNKDGWSKKSHLCTWIFIVASIAIVIYTIMAIARLNLQILPLLVPEVMMDFQIYLVTVIIILFSGGAFIYLSYYLTQKLNEKVLIGLGLIVLAFSYLLAILFYNSIIYYLTVILAGFGTALFFHNLINLIFNIIKQHGKSLVFCLAISLYFGQLFVALLTLHSSNNIHVIGLLTVVEILALIGITLIILSGGTFVKKKVNVKFVFSQIFKVFSIILLLGLFLFSYSSTFFLNISEENYHVSNSPPIIKIENSDLHLMFNKVYEELEGNLMIIPETGHIFAIPGGDFYRKPVLWDTAYIAQIWKYYNVSISEQILTNFINQINPNGLIPNTYHPLGIFDTITQCPLLTWACLDTFEFSDNANFLAEVYPKLKRYNQWWLTTRDFDGDGLYSWAHRDETGLDDSPRFDLYPMYQINALDLNCYLVLQMRSLAKIAENLNYLEDSLFYSNEAEQLANRIRIRLWDNETGFFYDKVGSNFNKIKTSSHFLPLFTSIATTVQAARMVAHLNDQEEFNLTYPIPSVARDEVNVFSNVMWRGPTWINLNYLIIRGLINYNYTTEASKIAYKTLKMAEGVFNETGTFWEFYNSTTGRVDDVVGKTGWVPASHYVGWDGLLTNLLIENLVGVSFNGSTIPFHPIIPSEWNSSKINLQLNRIKMNMTLLNNQINSSIEFTPPSFNNVTVIDLQTLNQTTYFTPNIQVNFTNFNKYRFQIN
ncbi:MAG: hypothetical protein HWN65_12185 [Candidatus Helarchaeota archaeon]|nr:hypothetical protein [Candidatus Helarchaeota archaeon]